MRKPTEYAIRVVCSHGKAKILMGAERADVIGSALELLGAIASGWTIEKVSVAEARKTEFGCSECVAKEFSLDELGW